MIEFCCHVTLTIDLERWNWWQCADLRCPPTQYQWTLQLFLSRLIEINQMAVGGVSFWPVTIYRRHHHHERGGELPTHRRVSGSTPNPPTQDAVGRQTYEPTVLTQCSCVLQIGAFDLRRPPAVLYGAHSSVSAAAKHAAASDEARLGFGVKWGSNAHPSPRSLVEFHKTHHKTFCNPLEGETFTFQSMNCIGLHSVTSHDLKALSSAAHKAQLPTLNKKYSSGDDPVPISSSEAFVYLCRYTNTFSYATMQTKGNSLYAKIDIASLALN